MSSVLESPLRKVAAGRYELNIGSALYDITRAKEGWWETCRFEDGLGWIILEHPPTRTRRDQLQMLRRLQP